jgi:hypothetical protein
MKAEGMTKFEEKLYSDMEAFIKYITGKPINFTKNDFMGEDSKHIYYLYIGLDAKPLGENDEIDMQYKNKYEMSQKLVCLYVKGGFLISFSSFYRTKNTF